MDSNGRVRTYETGKEIRRIRDLEGDVDKLYTEIKVKKPRKKYTKDPDDVFIHNAEELKLYIKSFGIERVDSTEEAFVK